MRTLWKATLFAAVILLVGVTFTPLFPQGQLLVLSDSPKRVPGCTGIGSTGSEPPVLNLAWSPRYTSIAQRLFGTGSPPQGPQASFTIGNATYREVSTTGSQEVSGFPVTNSQPQGIVNVTKITEGPASFGGVTITLYVANNGVNETASVAFLLGTGPQPPSLGSGGYVLIKSGSTDPVNFTYYSSPPSLGNSATIQTMGEVFFGATACPYFHVENVTVQHK